MGLVHVGDKEITVPDAIIDAGVEAVRMALAVDIPDIENADITIERPESPAIVTSRTATVVKRATPKG
jgi:hypothetical protein